MFCFRKYYAMNFPTKDVFYSVCVVFCLNQWFNWTLILCDAGHPFIFLIIFEVENLCIVSMVILHIL